MVKNEILVVTDTAAPQFALIDLNDLPYSGGASLDKARTDLIESKDKAEKVLAVYALLASVAGILSWVCGDPRVFAVMWVMFIGFKELMDSRLWWYYQATRQSQLCHADPNSVLESDVQKMARAWNESAGEWNAMMAVADDYEMSAESQAVGYKMAEKLFRTRQRIDLAIAALKQQTAKQLAAQSAETPTHHVDLRMWEDDVLK